MALCATLLCPSPILFASTVFRCEDANGRITYTLHGCPEHSQQALQDAYNPTPGADKPMPMATSKKKTKEPRARKSAKQADEDNAPVIVGAHDDGCGNRVTGSDRRTAIIRKQVRAGMTRSDVESALGIPDRISTQDGTTRYHYGDKEDKKRTVSFDEAGCAKGKR
jgi:hypothetical protein